MSANNNNLSGTDRNINASGASSHTFDADKNRDTTHLTRSDLEATGSKSGIGSSHHTHGSHNTTYGTTGTTGSNLSGSQLSSGTTGTTLSTTGVKTMNTVESVARDAQAQIDAQADEAIRRSRELNAQDHARLQTSIREATSSLEEQARQLKLQIDQEKALAEQHVKAKQQQKLQETAQVQQMEEQKIMEAAAARKLELEQKAIRLQQEIDAIVRQKTQEMMSEKPGNLVFAHQHQDTTVGAQLAGDIGHIVDLKKSGRVTETNVQGDVKYTPVQIQQQSIATNTPQVQSQVQTTQGPEVHEKHGGFFHALKTAITGGPHPHEHSQTQGTTQTVDTTGKHTHATANRPYDQQSTWAQDADKHMPQQAK